MEADARPSTPDVHQGGKVKKNGGFKALMNSLSCSFAIKNKQTQVCCFFLVFDWLQVLLRFDELSSDLQKHLFKGGVEEEGAHLHPR